MIDFTSRRPAFARLFPIFACIGAAVVLGACASEEASRPADSEWMLPVDQSARGGAQLADPGFIDQMAATRSFSLGRPTSVRFSPDGGSVLFLRSGPRSFVNDLYELDLATGDERVLLTASDLLGGGDEELTAEELARRERQRQTGRGLVSYRLSDDGRTVLAPLSGRLFLFDRATRDVREVGAPAEDAGAAIDPRFSPDGSMIALVRDGDLRIVDVSSGQERRLTWKESPTVTNGLAEFIAQEEMGRSEGYWWSPDSRLLAFERADTEGLETFYIADPANPEREPQSWPYPRAGAKNADVRLGIMSVTSGETRWVEWDREAFPYLAKVVWAENAPLTILVQNRAQTEQRLLAVEPESGSTSTLLIESDAAWVNIDDSTPKWLKDGSAFLWATEREGVTTLEMRAADGSFLARLTPLDIGFRSLLHVDEEAGVAFVSASMDPTQRHIYSVPLRPGRGQVRALTTRSGTHGASFADEGGLWTHSYSSLEGDEPTTVRDVEGETLATLRSTAEEPPFGLDARIFELPGAKRMRALAIRPRNFNPSMKYPVLVHVYGGPGAQMVTNSLGRGKLMNQWIADHGYIVVSFDGRGTPGRGRDWERAIKGDFISAPLEDQAEGLRALGEMIPAMDLSRVGIYGWSFGGYFSAMAVMRMPETFHVGVAGAPVADWADYDTHYTERYIGTPQDDPEAYRTSNVLTYAGELRRPLLIIHGTADDNVYFVHGLKMMDAVFRAGGRADFLPLAGQTHVVARPEFVAPMQRTIMQYFQERLGEPR